MRMLKDTSIDFIGMRKFAFAISAALILISIGAVMTKGLHYSIDFSGGSILQVRFAEAVAPAKVRSSLSSVGLGGAEIQRFGDANEVLIRIPTTEGTALTDSAKAALGRDFQGAEIRREETVGPKVGGELRRAALQSILFALGLILLYVTIRFEFRFALGAVVALAHDVTITVGALTIIGHEMSLVTIAALLTIVGFSLNDTIVVYDRIRENLRVPTKEPQAAVMNRSINQVLDRTIITSGTVLLSTASLLLFGGEVLWDFAFAMTVGVVVGTYSSDFVATPIVYEWNRRFPHKPKGVPAAGGARPGGAAKSRKREAAKAS